MYSNTQQILEELYHLDPTLRKNEESIKNIIEIMQKNRPEIVINDRFRSELKSRIISDIGGLSVGKERNSSNWKVVF